MDVFKNNVKELFNEELEEIDALINGFEVNEVSTKRLEELLGNLSYVREELELYFDCFEIIE